MLVWLGICAVVAFAATLFALVLGVAPAPAIHIAFAAGALPLIFGAIIHFVPVLTRSGTPARAIRFQPLPVQAAGIATPLGLAGILPAWSLHAAATLIAGAALVLLLWTTRRLRSTLGAPHPGARWYGGALICLFLAVSLVPVWLVLPDLRPALRLFHLHLNTLGFIGLAALGTLPVLVPTVLGQADPQAGIRLVRDLPLAAGGVVLVAAGAASAPLIAAAGALMLMWVIAGNLLAWQRLAAPSTKVSSGVTAPAVPLKAASVGLALLLLVGIAHGFGWITARPALPAFFALFLLPLVTGALTHLLPVWRHPGVATARRSMFGQRLGQGAHWRALLFVSGGLLLAFDQIGGLYPAAAGLAWFALALLRAFWLDRAGASDDNSRPVP
jgi:hypothetical protein